MKKRFLSFALILVLIFALVPAIPVLAADNTTSANAFQLQFDSAATGALGFIGPDGTSVVTEYWYYVDIPGNGTLNVDLVTDGVLLANIAIFASNATTMIRQGISNSVNVSLSESLQTGKYYIRVIRGTGAGKVSGSFTLTATFTPSDQPSPSHAITVSASPTNGGSVSGGGTFKQGESVTLTATPNSGWSFDGWYEGNTKVSSNASYTFIATANRTLEARFTQSTQFTITAMSSPASGGSVSGGGTFQSGASVTLTATPNSGWIFGGWYGSGTRVGTNATLTFNATQNRTLEARFTQREQGDLPFDNDHSDWAEKELIRAFDEDLFPPLLRDPTVDLRDPITRVEFAGVVVLAFENLSDTRVQIASGNPFTDTIDIYARMAFEAGLMVGVSADSFAPDTLLNREQAATAITRVFKRWYFPGWSFATDDDFTLDYIRPALFSDDVSISDWARDSVYFMAANEIIQGVGNNIFAPRAVTTEQQAIGYATATREQALIIALRMVEKMK